MMRRTKILASVSLVFAFFAVLWTFSLVGQEQDAAPAEESTVPLEGKEAGDLHVIEINGISYRFRWAPPGSFTMGSSESELERGRDELLDRLMSSRGFGTHLPERKHNEIPYRVTLTQGFWILETEVTQAMWDSIEDYSFSTFKGADLPIEGVTWNACKSFIDKLNGLGVAPAGYRFALPTEAQWEYACRAGTTTSFFWGDTLNGDKANCNGENPYGTDVKGEFLGKTAPVGSYEPNPWGVYDMHGNVAEWCENWYGDYYPSGVLTDPRGPARGWERVNRGGSWGDDAKKCRSSCRISGVTNYISNLVGFRLVLVPLAAEIPQETVNLQDAWTASFAGQAAGDLRALNLNGVDYRFRWAPPGSFAMGSPETETHRGRDEVSHDVTLTQGFWILETEVTQLMWKSIMGSWPSYFNGVVNLPVECVAWNDCQKFIARLNEGGFAPSGYRFALPTEAQWEYACRAGTTTPFSWGDSLNGDKANCDGRRAYGAEEEGAYLEKTSPVGSYGANPWGIFDMHGNVAEWCEDWYAYDYPPGAATDPVGPESGAYRVVRGGGWNYDARLCRSAYRDGDGEDALSYVVGFRLVLLSLEDQLEPETPAEVWKSSFAGQEPGEVRIINMNGVTYRFRWAPPGSFMMGSPETEPGRKDDEVLHHVTFTQGFWLLETEFTQAMWDSFGSYNSSEFKGADLPLTDVSWIACQELLNKLNRLGLAPEGARFALPTEAQWEYACRAGTTTAFYWGDSFSSDKANCNGTLPYGTDEKGEYLEKTTPVGSYAPNPWGLYDMHGNVAEWCDDSYGDYYLAGSATNPRGPQNAHSRITRGGSWRDDARNSRSASRAEYSDRKLSHLGFRFAIVPLADQESSAVPAEARAAAPPVEEWTSSVAGKEAGELRVIEVNGVPYRFRWAPPGSFTMGGSEAEISAVFQPQKESIIKGVNDRGAEELKKELDSVLSSQREWTAGFAQQHDVTLTRGFWILETELTQAMWEAVMGNNPSELKGAELPVGGVSWIDSQEFVAALNRLGAAPAGARFALPTEAQWEYACRAGTTTPFFWGGALNGDKANCDGTRPYGIEKTGVFLDRTTPVGSYAANPWGLFDMHGNVSEWCEDRYGAYPSNPVTDPRGCASGLLRVHRGGGWGYRAIDCRSASRHSVVVDQRYAAVGFRPVLVPITEETRQGEGASAQIPATPAEEWSSSFSGKEPGALRVIDVDGVPYRLRWAPPGSFAMGSSESEQEEVARPMKEMIEKNKERGREGWEPNDETLKSMRAFLAEEALHDVALTQGFWTLETEVTQLMWERLMGYNPSEFEGAELPVEGVAWDDCQKFVAKLNSLGFAPVGARFALPTEAQWEYACRAGTTTPFSWGDSLDGDRANCQGRYPIARWARSYKGPMKTTPVGSYEANPWGLYDMHGNVAEWCEDWFGSYPTGSVTDPGGPVSGEYRVKRGGSWRQELRFSRSAVRVGEVDFRNVRIGFRVVLVPLDEQPGAE